MEEKFINFVERSSVDKIEILISQLELKEDRELEEFIASLLLLII